jgi:GT2 family glycosyltransferase
MSARSPFVSVVLLVWNNSEYLFDCLEALQKQTYQDFEIILLDNGSSDRRYLIGLQEKYSSLAIIIKQLDSNKGFAAGNNLGVKLAQGYWLAFLNVDAFPAPDWLDVLCQATKRYPQYKFFASRQVRASHDQLLDGAGDSYHLSGLAWRRFYNRSVQKFGKKTEEVFSVCPAAALYFRREFLRLGGFDDDYFSYFEDVDLGFRLRLSGERCLYVPDAIVHHIGSASTGRRSDFSIYYGYRNLIWTFVKNMPFPLIWIALPLHIVTLLFFVLHLIIRGQGRVIWKAIFDAILGLPKMIEKRKMIQKNKKITTRELLKVMSTGLIEPYLEFMNRNRVI